jgi:hypothetical protein
MNNITWVLDLKYQTYIVWTKHNNVTFNPKVASIRAPFFPLDLCFATIQTPIQGSISLMEKLDFVKRQLGFNNQKIQNLLSLSLNWYI